MDIKTEIPDPPISVTVIETFSSENSLALAWLAGDDGGDLQWFLIEYGKKGEDSQVVLANLTGCAGSIKIHEFKALTAGTKYVFVVYSENKNGLNENGQTATGRTLGGAYHSSTVVSIIDIQGDFLFSHP